MNIIDMNDSEIIKFISNNFEKKRLSKKITSENLARKGGYNSQTYSNFYNQNKDIRLSTFIQILRGLGELDRLQELIEYKEPFRPLDYKNKLPKRIRAVKKDRNINNEIKWGDE